MFLHPDVSHFFITNEEYCKALGCNEFPFKCSKKNEGKQEMRTTTKKKITKKRE
jgi:hypothetical protein